MLTRDLFATPASIFFGAVLPSVLVLRKADKLALRYQCLETPFAHIVALSRVSLLLCKFIVYFPVFVALYLSTAW